MYIVYIHITAVERRVVVCQRAQSIMEKICKPLKKKKKDLKKGQIYSFLAISTDRLWETKYLQSEIKINKQRPPFVANKVSTVMYSANMHPNVSSRILRV